MSRILQFHWLKHLKSPWFYWHIGHRRIAVLSLLGSGALLWTGFVALAGFSFWGVALALVLDAAGFWLALAYLLFLRPYLPAWIGLRGSADAFIAQQVVVPVLLGFLVTRVVTVLVAKACGYTAPSLSPREPVS
ncbi:MAG: hypothetical protein WAT67_14825 [Candidatus Contendobacter sp.]